MDPPAGRNVVTDVVWKIRQQPFKRLPRSSQPASLGDSCEVGSLSALVPVLHANLLPDEFSLEVFGQGDHQVAHVWVVGFYVDLEIVFP